MAPHGVDPLWLALHKFQRRKYEECLEICDQLLMQNPRDQVGLQHR